MPSPVFDYEKPKLAATEHSCELGVTHERAGGMDLQRIEAMRAAIFLIGIKFDGSK